MAARGDGGTDRPDDAGATTSRATPATLDRGLAALLGPKGLLDLAQNARLQCLQRSMPGTQVAGMHRTLLHPGQVAWTTGVMSRAFWSETLLDLPTGVLPLTFGRPEDWGSSWKDAQNSIILILFIYYTTLGG
jgi:hypothetical protein